MAKIYILGPVGSGKTTLSKKLSRELNIRHYELDKVIWKFHPDGDIRRTNKEIEKIFLDIISNNDWIIENVGKENFNEGFKKADTIIYLKISKIVLYKRIIFRWIKQNLKIEKTTYKPNIKMLRQMIMWAKKDLENSKLNKLEEYKKKVIILNRKSMKKYKYRKEV